MNLAYPMYAIFRDGGYYLLAGIDENGNSTFAIMVFTDRAAAQKEIDDGRLNAAIKTFANVEQFRRLLMGCRPPKPEIVCDAKRGPGGEITYAWSLEVNKLLDDVLPPIGFMWQYPIFAINDGDGFASINGTKETGEQVYHVALFTDTDLAERYMAKAEIEGTIAVIPTDAELAAFVRSFLPPAWGVVFDPVHAEPGSIAKVCMDTATVLKVIAPPD